MTFIDKESEQFYMNLVKKYGYFHINSTCPISIDSLKDVEKVILKLDSED